MAGGQPPRHCDWIVKHARLLTADTDNSVVADGALAVADGRFVAVGSSAAVTSRYAAAKVIDADGGVVHPGFIDAHIHISQYTARTVLPAMARASAAGRAAAMGHWKTCLRPEDENASAALAAVDMARAGYTGFVDPGTVLDADAVAAAVEEVRLRAWLTDPYVGDRADFLAERFPSFFGGSFGALWPKTFEEAAARIGGQLYRNANPDALVRGFIGIYGEGTDSLELHAEALRIADTNGTAFHKHLGYAPHTIQTLSESYGSPVLQKLAENGLLSRRVALVHMNLLRNTDIAILKESGAKVIWCPYGQLAMIGSGCARGRMATAERGGIPVALATDIPRAFDFGDLGKLAWSCGQAAGDSVTAEQVFLMRTRHAAAAMGALSELGSLEVGKRADFAVRFSSVSAELGLDLFLETMVIGGSEAVKDLFVGGRPILRSGALLTAEPSEKRAQAIASVRRIAATLGLA
ncbi:amidohydrolase family protein [Pelagibius sp.]|uniref:amidohydrolase family protein n=1 Tax=Pelagibius sp. TaxID=1931238 RepID=UPI003BAE82CB